MITSNAAVGMNYSRTHQMWQWTLPLQPANSDDNTLKVGRNYMTTSSRSLLGCDTGGGGEGSTVFQNDGILPQHYAVSQLRRL